MGAGAASANHVKQDSQEGSCQRLVKRGSVKESGRYHTLPRKIQDDYDIQYSKVLGSGMNGSVYMAKGKTSKALYAVKGFKLHGISKDAKQDLVSEAEIFLMMDHPHVARLVAVYESESMLHLVMECMEGGELFDRIEKNKRFSEANAAHSVWQMLLAVHYLHSQEIVHRDIKLENFLYESKSNDYLKLIDFGFSHVWKPDTLMAASCGTLSYVAPEVLAQRYTKQCDLWSLGVVAFILTMGYMPFSGSENNQIANIMAGKYKKKPQSWSSVSASCRDFLEKLLQVDPKQRLTSEAALKHEWIANRDQTGHYHITPLARLDSKEEGASLNIDSDTIGALCEFHKASRFRRACMSLMAWSLTQEERAAVRDAFIELDVKRTGTIKLSELQQVLSRKIDNKDDEQIKGLFSSLTLAHTEEIHYSDFLAAMMTRRILMHDEHLLATFRQFDTDNSGYITQANLRQVLGDDFSESELKELIASVDAENMDKISYNHFVEYLRSGDVKDSHKSAALNVIDKSIAGNDTGNNEANGGDENDSPSRIITQRNVSKSDSPAGFQGHTEPSAVGPTRKTAEGPPKAAEGLLPSPSDSPSVTKPQSRTCALL
eukprot:TRINITY_DN7791_c0_g1_i2.p1 TRINITY_DN7791_c0_g1~~TRINITY_DN7791_c0_g1_i2.p1  ORF type:complete len:611 (-),score=87.49 TRINITY_DN7791_c0_g1_i2:84-1889(-)